MPVKTNSEIMEENQEQLETISREVQKWVPDTTSKFTWRVVPDELRAKSDILADAMTQELLNGKTIEVDNFSKPSNLYRAVQKRGFKLRSRTLNETTTILWLERLENNAEE